LQIEDRITVISFTADSNNQTIMVKYAVGPDFQGKPINTSAITSTFAKPGITYNGGGWGAQHHEGRPRCGRWRAEGSCPCRGPSSCGVEVGGGGGGTFACTDAIDPIAAADNSADNAFAACQKRRRIRQT
jgi:hypothetical protein